MEPGATVWWVLTVYTNLWLGAVFTVTCLEKDSETFQLVTNTSWINMIAPILNLLGQLETMSCFLGFFFF